MANFTLTAGADTVAGGAADDTVTGTAATLNAGDSLTGGAGIDTLALYGGGTFHVDQLASFTGFESITLINWMYGPSSLFLGGQSITVAGYDDVGLYVYLGSGAVTFQGNNGPNNVVYSTSASNWNAGNSIDGGLLYGRVYLNSNSTDSAVYDLTTNTLTRIYSLDGLGNNLTVKVNSAVAGGVTSFDAYGTNSKLVTSDAALDLSHNAVTGFTVASSNATGTNFTVSYIGNAYQVTGGSGTDTITAQGFAFSAAQRNVIFAASSIEKIIDQTGTYTSPKQSVTVGSGQANFTLTVGADTVVGGAEDDTVIGTAGTLNLGDSLTGGAGIDTLALVGGGTYHVDQLASFTGFELIRLISPASQDYLYAGIDLWLGSQSVAVIGEPTRGLGPLRVYLGSGAVACGGITDVYSPNASNWNAGNSIDGGSIYLNAFPSDNAFYDLTTNTLTNITVLHGANLTVQINSAVAGGIANFDGGINAKLVTSDAALDLSHSTVSGFTITTSNASGANFTVSDMNTALQIAGGSGSDTITALGFALNTDQRKAIFATSSIETIIDSSGTYTVHTAVANIIPDQSSPEDKAWSFQIPSNTFSDADGGDSLTYLVTLGNGDPLPSWLAFNSSTHTISGTPPANFNGQIALKITASDGSFTASDTFALNVTAVNDAPVVANAIVDQHSPEDMPWSFTVPANTFSDIDGNALAYTASLANNSVLPGWLSFNAVTRTFSGTPPANFNGQIALKVTASDGSFTTSDTFALNVTAVNDAPIVTSNSGGDTARVSIAENTTAVTTVTAADPDAGQALSYVISGGADASKFTINAPTGALSFITAPNFELPTDAGANNIYDVTVQVSDGSGGTDTQALAVTVTDVFENSAPTITSNGGGPTAAISIAEHATAVTTVMAIDPDAGQALSYAISGGADASKFTINAGTGALSFITAPNFEAPTDAGHDNVYDVTVRVSDGHGGIDAQALSVSVHNAADGNADILWQNTVVGTPALWLMDGLSPTTGSVLPNPGPAWHVIDAGDFNGDGNADIVWQGSDGTPAMWLMDDDKPVWVGAIGPFNPGPSWQIKGTGDFNGDGNADIVWQGSDGTPAVWMMDGTHVDWFGAIGPFNPGPNWQIKGTGDFNGDGNDDILWQGRDGTPAVWMMDGTHVDWFGAVGPFNPGPNWQIKGTGDFNGDGRSDILWQGSDGTPAIWLMDGNTAESVGVAGSFNPGPSWEIKGTDDFNGDGRSDILWQGSNGTPAIWLMDGLSATAVAGLPNLGSDWHIIA
jgi:hypothetical protein